MSKGNPIVKLRLNPETIRKIEKAIANREHIQRPDTNTLSEWIRGAIDERLAKLDRGRGRRALGKKRDQSPSVGESINGPKPQDSPERSNPNEQLS
jgi:hypothetical protein